jgi:CRP/FNR family transcriptional regulator, nitrogen fixation regulation protein
MKGSGTLAWGGDSVMQFVQSDIEFILNQVQFEFADLAPVRPNLPRESGSYKLGRRSSHSGRLDSRATRSTRAVFRLSGAPVELIATVNSFTPDARLYAENDPTDWIHMVISGTVRTYRVPRDGRRQIGAFYLPGEMFGLEFGETRRCAAEAVTHARLLLMERQSFTTLAERDRDIARRLWEITARALQRAEDHAFVLTKSAQERVAAFLIEMAERNSTGDVLQLPMSRRDIADYLGLTMETVCRTLKQLEKSGAIALRPSRCLAIRDRSALLAQNA